MFDISIINFLAACRQPISASKEKARGKVTRAPAIIPTMPLSEETQATNGN